MCDVCNDLTSPTSKQIPDIHIAVPVLYDTLKNPCSSSREEIKMGYYIVTYSNKL